jgi:putative ubiquitin-RnfH superfamily antitoxin RatB of RatAB toxin-antitoxin module
MSIRVQVVVAQAGDARVIDTVVDADATVEQAILASGIQSLYPHPEDLDGRVGIFGKLVPLHWTLRDGDRIEIYRRLRADPKLVRRARAQKR